MLDKICSISIDIDTLRFYHQIHGLPPSSYAGPDPVYTHALPRFFEIFSQLGIRCTLFVVGEDLQHPEHADVLREAVSRGHELANHTMHHPYRFTRLDQPNIQRQIALAEEAIEALLPDDQRVVGFRCPGYNVNAAVLEILRQRGYRYDSSIFPCPPYYIAKGLILAWLALRGRPSRSMLGSPRVMWSPTQPYLPAQDPHRAQKRPSLSKKGLPLAPPSSTAQAYTRGPNPPLWEIPMTLVPGLRFPYIGTQLLTLPRPLLPTMTSLVTRAHPLLNLELHAIELLDPHHDPQLHALTDKQPDLPVPLREKRSRFLQCFEQISRSHRFLPLAEATHALNQLPH